MAIGTVASLGLSVVLAVGMIAVSAASPERIAAHGGNCPAYDAINNRWGIQVTVFSQPNQQGYSDYWCPKHSTGDLGNTNWWDGDGHFTASNMSWHDIGDNVNMNDLVRSYSIYISSSLPGTSSNPSFYCFEFFKHVEYDTMLEGIFFAHVKGRADDWHFNVDFNDYSAVRMQLGDFETNDCPED